MRRLILEAFLPYRLHRLGSVISQKLKGVYGRKYGMTVPDWRVLSTLGQFVQLTAKAIGTHSAMHKTKVSRAVAALEKRRWLARSRNPDDRREELLTLTTAGLKAYNDIVSDMIGFESALTERLGVKNVAELETVLMQLEQALDISEQSSPSSQRTTSAE
jgi:DNA-binding MarR family transcriptional regulator